MDVKVVKIKSRLNTTIYHKPTLTGLYLRWTSLTSIKYKLGLIYCLLNSAWIICSEINGRNDEINKIKAILLNNEYQKSIIDREISKLLRTRSNDNIASAEQLNLSNIEKKRSKRYIT